MKKVFKIICILCLTVIWGCGADQTPEKQFKEVFDQTSDDKLFLWVPDLERIDDICKDSNKQFSIDTVSKLKNDIPLSKYDDEELGIRNKTAELLENLELKQIDSFQRYRILLRIGCEQEEKDYLVIYEDMLAKKIHIDKNLNVHEECYEVKSVSTVEEFMEYIDSLMDKRIKKNDRYSIQPSENFTSDFTQIPAFKNNYVNGYYEYTEKLPHVRISSNFCVNPLPCTLSDIECDMTALNSYPGCMELTEEINEIKEMEWIDYSDILWDEKEDIETVTISFDAEGGPYGYQKVIDSSLINEFIQSFEVISFYPDWYYIDYYPSRVQWCDERDESCHYNSIRLFYRSETKEVAILVRFFEEDSSYGYLEIESCLLKDSEGECEKRLDLNAYAEASKLIELADRVEKDDNIPDV